MKNFFYRISWDKDFKNKVFKWTCICFCSFACLLAIGVVCFGNFVKPVAEQTDFILPDSDESQYFLDFGDEKNTSDNSDSGQASFTGETSGNNSESGGSSSGGGGGSVGPGHVHSWYTVIDSYPWDESIWVQTGTRYICTGCGYSTTDSSSASAHSAQTGHKFRSEAIWEERIIHHAGSSHEQCDCGARR